MLKEEVEKAIAQAKNIRALGPDQIPAKLLKLLRDDSIEILTVFLNKIYHNGKIPEDWLKSLFVALPKKSGVIQCNDFRLISLMSHTLNTTYT